MDMENGFDGVLFIDTGWPWPGHWPSHYYYPLVPLALVVALSLPCRIM